LCWLADLNNLAGQYNLNPRRQPQTLATSAAEQFPFLDFFNGIKGPTLRNSNKRLPDIEYTGELFTNIENPILDTSAGARRSCLMIKIGGEKPRDTISSKACVFLNNGQEVGQVIKRWGPINNRWDQEQSVGPGKIG
jgi:hypothetical protein